jgi:hypothetical protein
MMFYGIFYSGNRTKLHHVQNAQLITVKTGGTKSY